MNLADYTWHALFCPPNQELKTGHELGSHGMPVVIPLDKDWRERPGAKHTTTLVRVPVFPRYLFTGFRERPNWEGLRERFAAVQGYMAFGDGPAIIRIPDMEWLLELRERLAGRAKPAPFHEGIKPGDQVRVREGHLLAGDVITVNKVVSKEIHTFKDFLGGLVLVKISLGDLEPV